MGLKFYRLLRTNEVEFFQVIQKKLQIFMVIS